MARFLFSRSWVAALLLALVAAPLAAELQPAVQPGGDIPRDFRPITLPPAPPAPHRPANVGSDAVQYIRREAMVPMRDGVRLYTALVLPRNARNAPIILDRTPIWRGRRPRAASGRGP
jgi:predicted acyl esterase